jgi:nicotinate-nucleotide pyrophosphorylase (carboxylating)
VPALPSYLSDETLDAIIKNTLAEDVGSGDVTTAATVAPETPARAEIRTKEAGVVAGLYVAERVFAALSDQAACAWQIADGAAVDAGVTVGRLEGPARALLTAERAALNVLQRMSGIATQTHRMVEATGPHDTRILDTRKTAPGLRLLDKWAVKLGGGTNHRLGLFDLILIKENHAAAAAGGLLDAIQAAQRYRDAHHPNLQIEVETNSLQEVETALEAEDVDIVLLDNMVAVRSDGTIDTSRLQEAVDLVDGRLTTEASGNVTLETVPAIAATGVDAISSGALTHSVTALDLSMLMTLR